MHHLNKTDPRSPALLRRVERYALHAHLSQRPRSARLSWGKKRFDGHIRAWPRTGAISFRVAGGAASCLGLPGEGNDSDLHFRIRGISFRCQGRVRQVQREQGRLLLKPDLVEWCARTMEVKGLGRFRDRALLTIKGPDGKNHEACVIGLSERAIRFVCWPCPKQPKGELVVPARLYLPDRPRIGLVLRIEASSQVFHGAQGRILTAQPTGDAEAYHQALGQLTQAVRSVA
jgi:hypothetical protein